MKDQKSVLLLEDNELEIKKVERAFSKLGITNALISKQNGKEGLKWLSENSTNLPGLILLDLNMPVMDGFEFLEEIKKDDEFKKIPVVIMTTSKHPSDKLKGFERQAAGYMVKPVRYSDFVDMLSTLKHYWSTSESAY
ncbi:MAG: response regulator [Balneola sp.]|nr:MAG: response regulator [Balneola sp.]